MKFYLLLFLLCAWLTLDVAKSLEYTWREAHCDVAHGNEYVKSCHAVVDDDEMDDYGNIDNFAFEWEVIKEIGKGTFSVRVMEDNVFSGVSFTTPVSDVVLKDDPFENDFCALLNVPKGVLPIAQGSYKNPHHSLDPKILPLTLKSANYNVSITLLIAGETAFRLDIIAEVLHP